MAPVTASFLGVGAPEAVLVGVVALILFGPKGLAQAAKSLGATLRAFAPTLRELTQVSSELKSTLEDEIGINELREEFQRPVASMQRAAKTALGEVPLTSAAMEPLRADERGDEGNDFSDPDIDRKRAESARLAWGDSAMEGSEAAPPPPPLSGMSTEQLEAELARRRTDGA